MIVAARDARRRRFRRALSLAALSLFSALLGLLLGELLLRAFMPQALAWNTAAVWEPVAGLGWQRRANLDTRVDTGEGSVRVVSDRWGHRVGAVAEEDAALRLLALGDSFVEALQVDYEQTTTRLLSKGLSDSMGRGVSVVNAGVGGWDPNQYLIAASRELERARYRCVLVFVYLQNDLVERRVSSFPASARITEPSLPPLGPATLGQTMRSLGVRADAFLRQRSHLWVFGSNLATLRRARSGSRGGHALSSALRSEQSSPTWAVTAGVLAEIAARAAQSNASILCVLVPPEQYVDADALAASTRALGLEASQLDVDQAARLLGGELRARGVPVVDATPALRAAHAAGEKRLYGRVDKHFSAAGHRVMAALLEPVLLQMLRCDDAAAGCARPPG